MYVRTTCPKHNSHNDGNDGCFPSSFSRYIATMSAPPKLNRSSRRLLIRKTKTLTFSFIFLLGIILGHYFGHFYAQISLSADEYPSISSLHSISLPKSTRHNGWDSIDVFYGSKATFESTLPKDLEWFSQAGQDEVVMSLLRNKTNGYFVDLAANDATHLSNTYVLETRFHWKGLCIEPNPQYWENLVFRENCKIVAAVVGKEFMQQVHFRFDAGDHGGIAGSGFDNGPRFKSQSEVRYTVTVEEILTKFDAPHHIDYLSLDVEGAEEFIMQGFPFDKYHVSIMTTERPSNPLRELLAKNGFKNIVRLTKWGEIMWAHESVWDSLDMSILDRIDEIKATYASKYT